MGHRNAAFDLRMTVERAGEANDLAYHEGQVGLHLKALFRQVRHVTVADLSLTREVTGAFDRYPVLLAMVAHGQVPMCGCSVRA